ncbi:oligopeptide transporter [Flagelloscypha sp. PMI_526]|nr:oligopeptide transporter [Flagelloscypha sp. PMI_526]
MATAVETQDVPTLHQQTSVSSVSEKEKVVDSTEKAVPKHHDDDSDSLDSMFDDHDVTKPFPIDPEAPEEEQQLTVRAIVVGVVLGAVVGASNIYLGLKTGFTFGASLFGAIFGFAILKFLGGGPFGPKENCTVQTAATAAGGMGIIFVGAVPAIYRIGGLLSPSPADDVGKLIALTISATFFGIFFVIPLRKYYIIHLKLTFPTPAATAYTIRSLHSGAKGLIIARKKALGLLYSFIGAFTYKNMISLENYGWWLEVTPAFYGAGMLSGLNASWSFFGGMVLAWGIIAPSLIATGKAVGKPASEDYPELITYLSMTAKDPHLFVTSPSPRYWLLWPGVFMMITYSFTDLFMNMIPIVQNMRKAGVGSSFSISGVFRRRTELDPEDEDQTPLEDRVPFLWWSIGLILTIIMSAAILATQFPLNCWSRHPCHDSRLPLATQLVFGGISKGSGMATDKAMLLNLTAGTIAAGAAAQSCDMCGDLKTWLPSPCQAQSPVRRPAHRLHRRCLPLPSASSLLFTKATPCIINPDDVPDGAVCPYGAPSIAAWVAVATAVASPFLPIPKSSGYTAIALGIFASVMVVIQHLWIPKKYWKFVPNWNSIGLAFVVPNTYYATAMAVGSTVNYFWEKKNPKGFDLYMFPIAAGLVAGEGLAGVLGALLAIVGADGGNWGTAVGCPA